MASPQLGESIPPSEGDEDRNSDCHDRLLLTDRPSNLPSHHRYPSPTTVKSLLFFGLSFVSGAALSLALISPYTAQPFNTDPGQQCEVPSQYSPVTNKVGMKYAVTQFNGSFMKEMVYRKPGSREVDSAWEALGIDYRASVISEEDGLASGLTKHHVQRAKRYGGGFFVNVEGLHHLHCLNIVRKNLYFNYDYYKAVDDPAFRGREDIVRYHLTHCLDTLRQVLICNVDTGVMGQVWTQSPNSKYPPEPFPDFNTRHRCKDYEAVRAWGEMNQVPPNEALPVGYVAPANEEDVLPFIP